MTTLASLGKHLASLSTCSVLNYETVKFSSCLKKGHKALMEGGKREKKLTYAVNMCIVYVIGHIGIKTSETCDCQNCGN